MAAPVPADKVKDQEYSNWLKVTLALYYMKSGLHTFIQSEVDCLHQSLVQKIYGGKTVPLPPCTTCHAHLVRRNKYSGVWTFTKQCTSYCDVWFDKLLALHNNPNSTKIYWDNSNVPSWPFKPWECAKVFMPRGQLLSSVGPAGCDAQAMLTLLTNCTHFHHKLSPQGLGLTCTVSTIRNKVMHDGEMKLSDADRKTFIQQIIQLLEDPNSLKSIEACKAAVGNIQKIDNDSLDVFFNLDIEMKGLKSAVNEFRLELGMQEKRSLDTADSLKEEYKQLREQITERFVDVENRMDAIERDIHSVKEQTDTAAQQQEKKHQELHTTVTSHGIRFDTVEENVECIYNRMDSIEKGVQSAKEQTDTALKQQEKKQQELHTTVTSHEVRLDTVEENLQSSGTKLQELKTNTDTALMQQEKKHQEIHATVTNLSGNVTSQGVRLVACEENVQSVGTKLHEFEINTDAALQQTEKKHQEMHTTVTHLSANVTSHGVRLVAVEENVQSFGTELQELKTNMLTQRRNNSGKKRKTAEGIQEYSSSETPVENRPESDGKSQLKKTPVKRRPQTDGLSQLKCQTENKLDTVRSLEYISTTQALEAKKLLDGKRSVVIKGNPGEGKTTAALHLIDNEIYRNRRVVVCCPADWKTVDTDWVDIVVLEDIFGQFDLDHGHLQEWMVYLRTIQEHVHAGKLQVIITTRTDILSKVFSKLGSIKLFSDDLSMTLSSEELTNSEKMSILNRELQRHQRNMNENEREKCISNFSGLIGFPECCLLFAGDSNLFNRGPEFFKFPAELFVENIIMLEDTRFLALAFLFCNLGILEDYLSLETMPESSKHLLMEVASRLHISEKNISVTLLRDIYDHLLGLYVVKSISDDFSSECWVKKACIRFSHPIVCEAVGQVLADRCLEIVVKYGDSEYLYQRTYTAEVKDKTSQNVFIPVSLYGLLAERMVHDVAKKRLVKNVVKHSALKQHQFLLKFKDELHKGNRVRDIFTNTFEFFVNQDLSEGECATFVQYVLQSDEDVLTLVFSQFLEFLACMHNMNSLDCWQCQEKQKLMELALYYHHFEIADKLIAMNACYTHISLCNAARHGDLRQVQTILKTLKKSKVFSPVCRVAKDALCRAYISGNQDVIELFLKEEITLDSKHVIYVVRHGDMNTLMKVIEHLKCHNNWNPHLEKHWRCRYFSPRSLDSGKIEAHEVGKIAYSIALYIAYCNEKFDIADYLVNNGVIVSMDILPHVLEDSSQKAVARLIQSLKDSGTWDSNCWLASVTLEIAYSTQRYDVYDLLIQVGVSLTMANLPYVITESKVSLADVKKAIQHLKDTDSWDPKCDNASVALSIAYGKQKHDVCDLLIMEGVSLTMNNLVNVVIDSEASFEHVKKVIQHLKDTARWNPKGTYAFQALRYAYHQQKYDLCDLLIQQGVSLTLNFHYYFISDSDASVESVKKAIQHCKDNDKWDPGCEYASAALENHYADQKYDVCDLLVREGVLPTMKNLASLTIKYNVSFESAKKVIQHLKDADNWDSLCDDAFVALDNAYRNQAYDVCALLVEKGVSVRMIHFPIVIMTTKTLEYVRKTIQNLKDNANWDPKCDEASVALREAYGLQKYDVCDLLIQEGVSLTMSSLPDVILRPLAMKNLPGLCGFQASFESVKKAIQHLKDTDSWDPKCYYASMALEHAYNMQMYDVCDLLFEEKVSLRMYNLLGLCRFQISVQYAKKAIQNLKETDNWDPKCDYASDALRNAYYVQKHDVCNLLIQEGVSLTMSFFTDIWRTKTSECVEKAIQHLKDTHKWDPKCHAASEALGKSYGYRMYHVFDLLIQEGVSLTMMYFPNVIQSVQTFESVQKIIQHLKDTANWDPMCDYASEALQYAYNRQMYDVCELLIQEGVSLAMKNLPGLCQFPASFQFVRKVIQHLKDTDEWDPKCNAASKALKNACNAQLYDVCDMLLEQEVSLTMEILPDICMISRASFQFVRKALQHLKDTDNWDPKCDDAINALEYAYNTRAYDVFDLLVEEKVSLRMKNLPGLCQFQISVQSATKAVQILKESDNWDPHCYHASKALENAYNAEAYDVCDLLVEEEVSLTMKNLPHLCWFSKSVQSLKKAIKHLKDTDNWDSKCNDAIKALEYAFCADAYDKCDLLVEEEVSLTMKNLLNLCASSISVQYLKKAIKHLKDTGNWDPKCDDAIQALECAFNVQAYDMCDLLIEEEVSLTMKYLPRLCSFSKSVQSLKKTIKHLKHTGNWDPKCDDAINALQYTFCAHAYNMCDLLIEEEVPLTMKALHHLCTFRYSVRSLKKAIKHLKDTGNWDPECDDASKALENACNQYRHDVCDLLIQEGVSLTVKNPPGVVC